MNHAEIVQKVRGILNEHGGDNELSITTDRVLLDECIESAIPDAVIILAQRGYAVNVRKSTSVGPDSCAAPDFISLVSIESPTWNRVVTSITEVGSPEYNMAMNQYTAPKKNSPICYKEVEPIQQSVTLHFMPDIDPMAATISFNCKYDGLNLNAGPKEATAVCYMTAALVMGMFGDDQGKQRLSDVSTNMLQ